MTATILGILVTALPVLLCFGILVFEVLMFLDVIKNKTIASDRRMLWVIGMILIHPFVAIVYYFTDYKHRQS